MMCACVFECGFTRCRRLRFCQTLALDPHQINNARLDPLLKKRVILNASSSCYSRLLALSLDLQVVLRGGLAVLLLQVAPQRGFVGEADAAEGADVRPLSTVHVHVVGQRGLLREGLVAQRAAVELGRAVDGHVAVQVAGLAEVFAAARAHVQQVGGARVRG